MIFAIFICKFFIYFRNILGPDFSLVLPAAKLVVSSPSNSPRHPSQKFTDSVNFQSDSDCTEKVSRHLSRNSSVQSLSLLPEHHSTTKSRKDLSLSPTAVGQFETTSAKDLDENDLIRCVEKGTAEFASLNLVKGSRNPTPLKFTASRTTFPDEREDDSHLNRSECKYSTKIEQFSGAERRTPLSLKSYGNGHQSPVGTIEQKSTYQPDTVRTIVWPDSEDDVVKDQIGEDISFNDTSVEEGSLENEQPSNNNGSPSTYQMNSGASDCSARKPYERKFPIRADLTKQDNRFDYDKIYSEKQKCRTPDSLSSKTVEQVNQENQAFGDRLNKVSRDYDDDVDEPASCRQSSQSTLSQYSVRSEPAPKSLGVSSSVNFPTQSGRTFHWSGSYEQLSETVGKDWARSCHWKPTVGEKTDKERSSSYGFPSVVGTDKGGHGDGKQMESTVAAGATEAASAEKEIGSLLLKYGANVFTDEKVKTKGEFCQCLSFVN